MWGVCNILEWLFLYEWNELNGMDDWRVHMECGECTSSTVLTYTISHMDCVHKGDFDGKHIYYIILMQFI